MRELAEHIMDIAQNAISANANVVSIEIDVNEAKDVLTVMVKDNGQGMSEEVLKAVISPFSTSRTTRKVGLGIPMFKETARTAGGDLKIDSKQGCGTTLNAAMTLSHIDRPPLGAFCETLQILMISNPQIDFVVSFAKNGKTQSLDTREIKDVLKGVPLSTPDVSAWILESLRENELMVFGGKKI